MSDKNNQNDPLEQFFRNKAEEFDIEYREKDWQDLEKRLDHKQTILSYKRKTRLAAVAAFLLFSVLGYFIYNNSNKINDLNQQISQDNLTETPEDSSARSTETPLPPTLEDLNDITENLNENIRTDSTSADTELSKTTALAENEQPNREQNQILNKSEISEEQITNLFEEDFNNERIQIQKVSTNNVTPPHRENLFAAASNQNADLPHSSGQLDNITQSAKTLNTSAFSIGVLGSPDLSTVNKLSNFDQPGYKFGLSLGYAINDKFTVSSGLIQSKVRYNVKSQTYDPYSISNSGTNPSQLFAECIILDIPINVEYNFREFNTSRFFVKTGLSTYIMLNEEYQFDYDNYQPGQTQQKTVQSGKAHFMSNIGFSIGYEWDFHNHLSLRAEPFINVPLQNVGWGDVKLYSLGTFVSVRYRL